MIIKLMMEWGMCHTGLAESIYLDDKVLKLFSLKEEIMLYYDPNIMNHLIHYAAYATHAEM